MPQSASIMNSFIGGLKTEFTGLNFPENACTDTENCVFSIIGDVLRREGIDLEDNAVQNAIFQTGVALNTYKWTNVGGDGQTQILVAQIGTTLYFFQTSAATTAAPVSAQLLSSNINFTSYQAAGNSANLSQVECQFSDGNGYLFIYHPDCDPFYCTYNAGIITANRITVQIRDFNGYNPEPGNPPIIFRPTTLTNEHNYNLQNQGWVGNPVWTAVAVQNSVSVVNVNQLGLAVGAAAFTVATGLVGVTPGQTVTVYWNGNVQLFQVSSGNSGEYGISGYALGTVVSYAGSSILLNITSNAGSFNIPTGYNYQGNIGSQNWTIEPGAVQNTINTFKNGSGQITGIGFYPSNADIWYEYKDSSGTFNPGATFGNVSVGSGQAPQGHFILNAFNQNQTGVSNIPGITSISTVARPKCGTWFQGRVWYSGVDASQQAGGDAAYYTWTENIYFSQIVQTAADFGSCYSVNDPTDETLNELLPSDGGVIVIQGCGSIYQLFTIQNGILVFAANGVWMIRGNSGLGFTANDYSINKISNVQSISSTSFVNVNGLPMFWNEEGIYFVQPSKEEAPYGFGGLLVEPMTVGTILTYYNNIPRDSKRYVRGDYNPITYIVEWCFRSTQEAGISNRYQFDTILNLNIYNRAFYPYTISSDNVYYISDVNYITYPSGILDPTFKYFATDGSKLSFAEEKDDVTWLDWFSVDNTGVNYTSYFVSGYNIHGKALRKWNSNYINMFLRNDVPYAYTIQGLWDFTSTGNAGRWSTIQTVTNYSPNYSMNYRRHKLRGQGMSLQIKVSSVQGQPFDIMGWSMFEEVRTGP